MVFVLLTEIIIDNVIINPINIRKTWLEGPFTRGFCSCKSGFYSCSNNILYVFICIKSWLSSKISKNGYRYIRKPCKWSLSAGKLVWASKKWQQPKRCLAGGFKDITLNLIRAFAGCKSHEKWKNIEKTSQKSILILSKQIG